MYMYTTKHLLCCTLNNSLHNDVHFIGKHGGLVDKCQATSQEVLVSNATGTVLCP